MTLTWLDSMLLQVANLKNLDKPDPEMHDCFQLWLQSDKLKRTSLAQLTGCGEGDDPKVFLDYHEFFTWDQHYFKDLVIVRPKSDDPVQYNLSKLLFFKYTSWKEYFSSKRGTEGKGSKGGVSCILVIHSTVT